MPQFHWSFLHPRFWPIWLLLACWFLVAQLPYRWQMGMGRGLGLISMKFARRRRDIAETNLKLCFPQWSDAKRLQVLRENFASHGMALFETGIGWFWPRWRMERLFTIEGLEHLPAEGEPGAVMLAMHFTTLDLGATLFKLKAPLNGMYRSHKNPVYDWAQYRGRLRFNPDAVVFAREDVRTMIRLLRDGKLIWYAPDQDYGPKQSVFVPFFGVMAASVTGTARFARMGRAKVVPFVQTRLPKGQGYKISIRPPLDNFPTDNDEVDARRINALIEDEIRLQPEQYLWSHRRFKTRPEGEASVYPRK